MSDDLTPTNPAMPVGGDQPCATCGSTVPAGARFCPNCGAARSAADAPAADTDSTRVMAPIATGATVVEEEVVERPAPVRERPWPWALTLGVPAAIILLLLIVLAFRSIGNDNGGTPDETTTSSAPATTVTTARSATTRPAVTAPPQTSPQTSPPETSPPTAPPTTSPPATQPPDTVSVP